MIELELWRARIGLYHAASGCRRSRRLKNSSQSHRLSTTTKWGSKEAVDDIPFALRSCIAGVSLLLVVQCILTFLKKQYIRKALSSFVEGSYRVVKAVLTSGVPLLLKVCVVMIPLLLLLAGDVERNPGPTEGTTGTYVCMSVVNIDIYIHLYTCTYSNTLSVALQFMRSICVI